MTTLRNQASLRLSKADPQSSCGFRLNCMRARWDLNPRPLRAFCSLQLRRIGGSLCRAVRSSLAGSALRARRRPCRGWILLLSESYSARSNSSSNSFREFLNLKAPSLIFPTCEAWSTWRSTQQFMFQSGIRTILSLVAPEGTGNRS